MLINYNKLIKLPVITQLGTTLGKVCDLEIDNENQQIASFIIKSDNIVKGLFENKLIIKPRQIIKITSEKIIVEDLNLKNKLKNQVFKLKPAENKPIVNSVKY